MGGKSKGSQRTKNNVRPSSSGRSAELLSNTLTADTIYFGATSPTGKPLPALFSTLATPNLDPGLTAEYLVCFKKFNKKDPITKTKALQELTELVKTGNVADAEAALLSWTHYYQFLTVDNDRRVREATQACHGALVSACGRRVAPQLRRLLPVWLLARHDDHAPVGHLAQTHLQNTFPESKMPEALSYCKSEIISLLIANLTGNAETMLAKRVEDQDEKEAQISRILASSLRALESFLTELPAAHDDWLWDALAPLLQRGFFWGLVRNPAQSIRAAWYGAAGRLLQRCGARLAPDTGRRAARTLLAEPERECAVAAQRWAALLLLMTTVQEWHTWLDKKDLLVTRLLDAAENGGWGAAHALSGLFPAILASLPPELLTKDFYITFFNAAFTGLINKQLLSSKSERQSWISGISECLQLLSARTHDFTVEVVTLVHRTWLETVLNVPQSAAKENLIKHSMAAMAALIKHWLQRAKDASGDKYDQLARNFWQNFGSTIANQVDNLSIEQEDITRVLESHSLLLITLQSELSHETKKKLCIHFEDQKEDQTDLPGEDATPKYDPALMERLKHNLNGLAEKTSCAYFDFAYKKQVSQAVCPFLAKLCAAFESKVFFLTLARHFNEYTIYCFYDKMLKPWLAGDTMRCKDLADIVFVVVKYLTEDEQDAMFHSFQQFPPVVIEWCLTRALVDPHRRADSTRRWLRGGVAGAGVMALGERGPHRLLLACLAPDHTGEVLVNEYAVSAAVQATADRLLTAAAGPALQMAARDAAQLAVQLARGHLLERCALLLAAFFTTNMRLFRAGSRSCDSALAVRAAWRDTMRALPAERRGVLLLPALRDMAEHVFSDINNFDTKLIADMATFCPFLVCTSEEDETDIDEIVEHSEKLLSYVEINQPRVTLDLYALRCDCILGNITAVYINMEEYLAKISSTCADDHDELTRDNFVICAYRTLFRTYFIQAITRSAPDERMLGTESRCELVLQQQYFREEMAKVLYDFVLITTLCERYAFWPHYALIKETKQVMESALDDIVANISLQTKDSVLSFLTESYTKNIQHYSIYARKVFEMKYNEVAVKVRNSQKTSESANNSIQLSESISETLITPDVSQKSAERPVSEGDDLDNQPHAVKAGFEPAIVQNDSSIVVSDKDDSKVELNQNQYEITSVKNDSEMQSDIKDVLGKETPNVEISQNESKVALSKEESKIKTNQNDIEVALCQGVSKIQLGHNESNITSVQNDSKIESSQHKVPLGEDDSKVKSDEENSTVTLDPDDSGQKVTYIASGKDDSKVVSFENESDNNAIEQNKSELKVELNNSENPVDQNYGQGLNEVSRLIQNSSSQMPSQWLEMFKFDILKELSLQADAKYTPEPERDLKTRYVVMMRSLVCAYPADMMRSLLADICRSDRYSLEPVVYCYYKNNQLMLFEKDLTEAPWQEVVSNAAIVDFMSELVGLRGTKLPAHCWDFINITLSSLMESVAKSAHRWGCTNVGTVLRAASGLLLRVRAVQTGLRAEREVLLPAGEALVREWDDIFAPSIHRSLYTLLLVVLRSTETPVTGSSVATLAALPGALPAEWWSAPPADVRPAQLAQAAAAVLLATSPHPYKYLAYRTLRLVAEPLVREDAETLKQWSSEEEECSDSPPERPPPALCFAYFEDALLQLQELTETALSNVKLCEGTCEMVPFTDSHNLALGYLLLAAATLELARLAHGDLAQTYVAAFRRNKHAEALMSCTLRLLPAAVAAFAFERAAPPPERALRPFSEPPALSAYEGCDGGTLGALACHVLAECVGGAGGGAVLGWCGAAPARVAGALRRLVRAAVAPVLLRRHLRQLRERADELPDAAVTVLWSRGEVQCRLLVEERPVELTVRFAAEHPLVPPLVAASAGSPLADTSFLVKYLTYQNGSLLSALKMWTRALSARVLSFSQCYICYFRLHPASGRLPRVRCHQCRNNFHYVCLHKWFETSNKSTCPLCRSKF